MLLLNLNKISLELINERKFVVWFEETKQQIQIEFICIDSLEMLFLHVIHEKKHVAKK